MEKIKVLLLLHISCLLYHNNSFAPTDMLICHEFLMQKFSCVDSKHDFLNNLVCNPFNGNEGMLNASVLWLCACTHNYVCHAVQMPYCYTYQNFNLRL